MITDKRDFISQCSLTIMESQRKCIIHPDKPLELFVSDFEKNSSSISIKLEYGDTHIGTETFTFSNNKIINDLRNGCLMEIGLRRTIIPHQIEYIFFIPMVITKPIQFTTTSSNEARLYIYVQDITCFFDVLHYN